MFKCLVPISKRINSMMESWAISNKSKIDWLPSDLKAYIDKYASIHTDISAANGPREGLGRMFAEFWGSNPDKLKTVNDTFTFIGRLRNNDTLGTLKKFTDTNSMGTKLVVDSYIKNNNFLSFETPTGTVKLAGLEPKELGMLLDYVKGFSQANMDATNIETSLPVIAKKFAFERSKSLNPAEAMTETEAEILARIITDIAHIENKNSVNSGSILKILGPNVQANADKYFSNNHAMAVRLYYPEAKDLTEAEQMLRKELGERNLTNPLLSEIGLKHLVDDILGNPLFSNKFTPFLRELQGIARVGKYTANIASGFSMLTTSAITGFNLLASKGFGLSKMIESSTLTDFMLDNKILQEYTASAVERAKIQMEYGSSMIDKMSGFFTSKIPGLDEAGRENVENVLRSGIHNIWDIYVDPDAKKLAVAQAITKVTGHTDATFKEFETMLRNGEITQYQISQIRNAATQFYSDFKGGGVTALNSRNSLQRIAGGAFNFMQTYMNTRLGEIQDGARMLARGISNGEIVTWADLVYHINIENQEMKGVLNNILFAGYLSSRLDRLFSSDDREGETDTLGSRYITGLSDYISSLDSSTLSRMLSPIWGGTMDYYKYANWTGDDFSFGDALQHTVTTLISNVFSAAFKELNVLNVPASVIHSLSVEDEFDVTWTKLSVQWDKAFNGLGRFGMLENEIPFGYKTVHDDDDVWGFLTLTTPSINKVLDFYSESRDVSNVIQSLEATPSEWIQNIIRYIPVAKMFGERTKNPAEAQFKLLQTVLENDKVMQGLYAGDDSAVARVLLDYKAKFPDEYDEKQSAYFKELTNMDYVNSGIFDGSFDKGLAEFIAGSKTATEKEGVFTAELARYLEADTKAITDMNEAISVKNILAKQDDMGTALSLFDEHKKRALGKMFLYAQQNNPGSGRVLLSYLANNLRTNMQNAYTGKEYSQFRDIPKNIQDKIEFNVISQLYPLMYEVDKTSYIKLMADRVNYTYSNVTGSGDSKSVKEIISSSTEVGRGINGIMLADVVAYAEAVKGQPSAARVRSVMADIGNFVKDEGTRLALMNHVHETITSMPIAPDDKKVMQIGNIMANMPIIKRIANDSNFQSEYPEVWNESMNIVFGTNESLSKHVNENMIDDLRDSAKGRAQYTTAYGKKYSYSPYSKSNYSTAQQFQSNVPALTQATQGTYKPQSSAMNPNSGSFGTRSYNRQNTTYQARFLTPRPQFHDMYVKISGSAYSAGTQEIVKQSVRRYPAQLMQEIRFKQQWASKKIKYDKYIMPKRRLYAPGYARRVPNPNLPGGLAQSV